MDNSALPNGVTSTWDRANQVQVWQQAWKYYRGNPPRPLLPKKNEPDDNLILSFGRLIVNKGVSYLFGQAVSSEIEPPEGAPKDGKGTPVKRAKVEQMQVWLDEFWRRNRRAVFLKESRDQRRRDRPLLRQARAAHALPAADSAGYAERRRRLGR